MGTVPTQSSPLYRQSRCPVLAVLLQGGLPWRHLCAHSGVYLGGVRGFIYGFIPYEEVQVINAPQYPPLGLVDHLRRFSDGDTWGKTAQSVHHHTRSFQPSRKEDIDPMHVQAKFQHWGSIWGQACSQRSTWNKLLGPSIIFSKAQRNLAGLLSKLTKAVLLNFLVSSEKKSLKIVNEMPMELSNRCRNLTYRKRQNFTYFQEWTEKWLYALKSYL